MSDSQAIKWEQDKDGIWVSETWEAEGQKYRYEILPKPGGSPFFDLATYCFDDDSYFQVQTCNSIEETKAFADELASPAPA